MKKKPLLLLLAGGLIALLMFQSSAPPPPPNPLPDIDAQAMTLEQAPPLVTNMWVQKLQTPLPNGNNMLFMLEIDSSVCYDTLTDTLDIYYGSTGSQKVTFFDNGTNGDVTPSDNIYSAYVTENIQVFRNQIVANENALITSGHYLKFNGHTGEDITAIPHFDAASFDAFMLVPMHPDLTRPSIYTPCTEAIYKERSLFITHLSVVEDPARTYNFVTGNGNRTGAWTFGTFIKNIVNNPVTGTDEKVFLKEWLKHWTKKIYVNGDSVAARIDIRETLIRTWLINAGVSFSSGWDPDLWESYWNSANTSNLLEYAPFKLTAIVNRIDLRGNPSFSTLLKNAGETRFIFTALEADPAKDNYGKPLMHKNPIAVNPPGGFIDWEGFNIIFEYGNITTNLCDLVDLAEDWKELSNYDPTTSIYRDYLQAITDRVTTANAGSVKGRPNGSALNRIRTNERVFDFVGTSLDDADWERADWEFRQFELDATSKLLKQVPLTNTPTDSAFRSRNLYSNLKGDIHPLFAGMTLQNNNLIQWAFFPYNRATIMAKNHLIPYTYPSGSHLLAGAGKVTGEYNHYLDLEWESEGAHYKVSTHTNKADYPDEREVRHLISLNTCQGCHNGETKTVFTQVRPIGYGEQNNYWQTVPDHQVREIDNRFIKNIGETGPVPDSNYKILVGQRYFAHVSPFLTGRNYDGIVPLATYVDDSTSGTENATDNTMNGLFYVNDPANDNANNNTFYYGPSNKKFGYNDLERRKQDLCNLITAGCGGSIVDIATKVNHRPLPFGSH